MLDHEVALTVIIGMGSAAPYSKLETRVGGMVISLSISVTKSFPEVTT